MRIGSLFSGIGGLELGLERAGVGHVVWQVEKEPYCRAVLATHWPDAVRYDDVQTVHGRDHCPNPEKPCAHCIPGVDVICGGFPCQDISYAGKGGGLDGERSGLWYEFARIVRELGPRFVVVENVAALLSRDDGRWFGAVLGTLADLGYDAEWSCVQACDVGAPHRRDRVFLVAYAQRERSATGTPGGRGEGALRDHGWHDARTPSGRADVEHRLAWGGAALADANGEPIESLLGGRGAERGAEASPAGPVDADDSDSRGACPRESDVADAERGGSQGGIQQRRRPATELAAAFGGDRRGHHARRPWESEPDVGRVAHGVSASVVAPGLTALGNAVVPQVAEVVGRVLLQIHEELEAGSR